MVMDFIIFILIVGYIKYKVSVLGISFYFIFLYILYCKEIEVLDFSERNRLGFIYR